MNKILRSFWRVVAGSNGAGALTAGHYGSPPVPSSPTNAVVGLGLSVLTREKIRLNRGRVYRSTILDGASCRSQFYSCFTYRSCGVAVSALDPVPIVRLSQPIGPLEKCPSALPTAGRFSLSAWRRS